MSENRRVVGKLRVTNMTEADAEAKCKELGIKFYDKSWSYALGCESEKYCFLNGMGLCEILEFSSTDDLYYCNTDVDGAIIKFDAIYYNGGAHWTEVVEDHIIEEANWIMNK